MAVYLSDVIRSQAGWPVNLDIVDRVLSIADHILAADGGRNCRRALTPAELEAFGVSEVPPHQPQQRDLSFRVTTELHRQVREAAEAAGLSMNTWGVEALAWAVKQQARDQ